VVAAAPTDPIDRSGAPVHLSATGTVHAIAGRSAFACFGIAIALLTRDAHRRTAAQARCSPPPRSACRRLGFSATETALGLFGLFGLAERVLLPAYVGWLLLATGTDRRRSPRARIARTGTARGAGLCWWTYDAA
jgi:hypothetical protein